MTSNQLERHLYRRLRQASCALVLVGCSAALAIAPAPDEDPAWLAYQELIELCHKDQIDDDALLGLSAAWRRDRYQQADAGQQAAQLKRLCKDPKELSDIELVSTETEGNTTTLLLKATWNDLPMKGKVSMVLEGSSLKLDESAWASGE